MHLYNASQNDLEGLEGFFLRLSGQAAQCEWSLQLEKEVVCIRPGDSPEEIIKSALYKRRATSPL